MKQRKTSLQLAMKASLLIATITIFSAGVSAQNNSQYIRIAKIVVDSSQLDNFKAALKEEIETAVRTEPGVIMLYAVYEKENPTHVTVFEIYADENAYKSHIQTVHFKKYKDEVSAMVKSLQLIDMKPIALEAKRKI